MHRIQYRVQRRSVLLLAVVAVSCLLAACAAGGAGDDVESAPATTASAAPSGTPTAAPASTPTATPTATPEEQSFETQNGTMRIRIPAGWTVEDRSGLVVNHDGRQQWDNAVRFTAPTGEVLGYYDGYMSDTGVASTEHGVVDERPIADGVVATAWWERYEDGPYRAFVSLQPGQGAPAASALVGAGDANRGHSLILRSDVIGYDAPSYASQAEAEAALSTPEVQRALDIMSTLELTGVDQYAMPEGVEVEGDGPDAP
ncbi:hypothetical protein [Agrococcus terreus]|uniref:Lipoprotein n=1 Tax=Agrococcus terreus TaxID=574649 RepID=A0ABQ2KPD8_9MICO|nr:hypothetical protein [Agrococcus terreus]GGN89360.1 hypothetical protein GCM10010968_25930 [Agrococcus terreus]